MITQSIQRPLLSFALLPLRYRIILCALVGLLPAATIPFAIGQQQAQRKSLNSSNELSNHDWDHLKRSTQASFQLGLEPTFISNLSISDFESKCFRDGAPFSVEHFLKDTDNTNLYTTPWFPSLQTKSIPEYRRQITYLHPVQNPMAPPMARSTKQQRIQRFGPNRLLIETVTTVQDVQKADCFHVVDRILVETSPTSRGGIVVSAYFHIEFTKSTLFRSVIEKTTAAEFRDYLQGYGNMIQLASNNKNGARSNNIQSSRVLLAKGSNGSDNVNSHASKSQLPWLSYASNKRLLSLV